MSLMDALLQEEYLDPQQVCLSQRSDGRSGRGSLNDPADTSVQVGPPLFSSTFSFDPAVVLVVTPEDHNYTDGTLISIAAKSTSAAVNGRAPFFPSTQVSITRVSNRAFTYRLATPAESAPDSLLFPYLAGNPDKAARVYWPVATVKLPDYELIQYDAITVQGVSDPQYGGNSVVLAVNPTTSSVYYLLTNVTLPSASTGSGTIRKLSYRFDQRMADVPGFSLITLGISPASNPIRTRGIASAYASDSSLQKLFCGFQVKNGQKIRGSGIDTCTLRLENAIDQLTPTGVFGSFAEMDAGVEISDITLDSFMRGQFIPASKATYGTSHTPVPAFAPVAVQGSGNLKGGNSRARRLRFIDWGTQAYPEAFVFMFQGGAVARANNVIEDCVVEKPSENNAHETTILTAIGSGGSLPNPGYELAVAANGTACVLRRNYLNLAYANGVTNQGLPVISIQGTPNLDPISDLYGQFTVTIRWDSKIPTFPRGGANKNNIALYFVLTASGAEHPFYRGSFPILSSIVDAALGRAILTCRMVDPPSAADWAPLGTPPVLHGTVGITFHGLEPFFGSGGVAEGNAVYECHQVTYADTTGSTRDSIIRYNYWSNAFSGVTMNFSDPRLARFTALASVARALDLGDAYLVRVTTVNPHFLTAGDPVQIFGVRDSDGKISEIYNNNFYVLSNPSPSGNVFYYRVREFPTLNPQDNPVVPPIFAPLKATRRLDFHANVVDLIKTANYTVPVSNGLVGFVDPSAFGSPLIGLSQFPGWAISDNVIRNTDGLPTLGVVTVPPYALRAMTLGDLNIGSNLVDVGSSDPFQYLTPVGRVRTFNNMKMSGDRLPGSNLSSPMPQRVDDTMTAIEDAMCL